MTNNSTIIWFILYLAVEPEIWKKKINWTRTTRNGGLICNRSINGNRRSYVCTWMILMGFRQPVETDRVSRVPCSYVRDKVYGTWGVRVIRTCTVTIGRFDTDGRLINYKSTRGGRSLREMTARNETILKKMKRSVTDWKQEQRYTCNKRHYCDGRFDGTKKGRNETVKNVPLSDSLIS